MTPGLLTNLSRGGNLIKNQVHQQLNQRSNTSRVAESRFDDLLARHSDDHAKVFVHVGLSDISSAFDTNPYEFLLSKLDEHFQSVLAPGFTDYFPTSGIYHKQYSRPKHGTFASLFLEDADYRTDDALKSILVRGPYRFEECVHHDSYHPDGCFAQLASEDTLVLNVGTPWFTCSHLHYLESRYGVEYMTETTTEGVMYTSDTEHERIEQTSGVWTSPYYSWNRPKIERKLDRDDASESYDLNGLRMLFFTLSDLEASLGPRLREDPYYLVTL